MTADARPLRPVKSSRNILLRELCPADQGLVEPHVNWVDVSRGAQLMLPEQRIESIYFPDTATVSVLESTRGGRPSEIAVVGREGMIGWPALLNCECSTHIAVCQGSGTLLRISADGLRKAALRSASLQTALLKFVHIIIVQMAQAIASHLQDSLDRRLARWLLMRHDRAGGDILLVHHEEIADRLNVRRASITDRLHILEGEQMIRCNRGRILIRNRDALEVFAGESYGIVEAYYRSLIAPFGKSPQNHPS